MHCNDAVLLFLLPAFQRQGIVLFQKFNVKKMKKIFIAFLLIIAINTVHAQFTKATIQASGLTCAMCTRAIDNALKQLSFVESIQPDIKNSSFTVQFKENEKANIDALKQAVEDAGFFVARFSITGRFNNIAIKNDDHSEIEGQEYHFLNIKDQVLNGEKVFVIVDKNFLTPALFKKYSASTAMQCIKTGRAGSCCEKDGLVAGTRIYHVTM